MHEHGVRSTVIDRIMGWAPRTVRERHYVRVAPQVMHDAILTLYRDDPTCPQQLTQAAKPEPTRGTEPIGPWLAREQERLSRLEAELGIRAWRDQQSV